MHPKVGRIIAIGLLAILTACNRSNTGGAQPGEAAAASPVTPIDTGPTAPTTPSALPATPPITPPGSQTAAAPPLLTQTPEVRPCIAADFLPDTAANISGAAMTFTISLTNSGNAVCILQGPPQVKLVNCQGLALNVDTRLNCFNCGAPVTPGATQAAPLTDPTAAARHLLEAQIRLAPEETVKALIIWTNWCEPFPEGGVTLHLELPGDGALDLNTDATAGGRCTAASRQSMLLVSQYYR